MANIKSAKKRIKTIDKKTARNIRIKGHVEEAEKAFLAAVKKGDADEAQKTFNTAEKKIMQAAAKGTYHKNTASRKVSRLAKRLNSLKAEN
jgi:small subunit ribosomal protein S20